MNLLSRLFYYLYYLRQPPWDTGITPPEVEEFVQKHPAGRALDLGCGTGTNVIYLTQHGWQAIGIDFVDTTIRKARAKARQAGVEATFITGDVTRLRGVDGAFDLVLDIGCFHSLSRRAKQLYVANLSKLLAPEGSFLLYGFINPQDGGKVGVSPADLELLAKHLQVVSSQTGMDGRHSSTWLTYQRLENVGTDQ